MVLEFGGNGLGGNASGKLGAGALTRRSNGENQMPMISPRVRNNYLAIAVAATASILFLAIFYTLFLDIWLNGIGRDRVWLASNGASQLLQSATAFVAAGLLATLISSLTQLTGAQTAVRGMKVAASLWLGCVLPIRATETVFEVRGYSLFALNLIFWLVAMLLMGAIVGAWKKTGIGGQGSGSKTLPRG